MAEQGGDMADISRATRQEIVRAVAGRYQASSKGDKTRILDEFVRLTVRWQRWACLGGIAIVAERVGVVNLGEGGEAMWAFQEGQIGEGAAAAEGQERLCELKDSTPAKFQLCTLTNPGSSECSWTLLMVPVSEVPTYLDISAVYAGEDRNDLGLSENCRPEPIAGMSTAAKVGIGIGAAVLAAGIIEEIDDEDKPPASPITP